MFKKLLKEGEEKTKKYLRNIKNASTYSVEFINSLINYSEVGRSKVELSSVNLDDSLENALTNFEVTIKDTKAI